MGSGSTKRNRKKSQGQWGAVSSSSAAKRQAANARSRATREELPPRHATGEEMPERAWLIAGAVVLLLATALRFYALELRPLHHDEGVNGFFLTNLLRQGVYHYDPSNYHGPTLYYLTLPFVALFGLTTFAVRSVTAAFGVATVWLVLSLRRYVGATGALAAAALVAVSPACVFYSRYFIHESLFVFFTLGIVVAALRFYETGAAAYLLFASASAALLFATKETAFISVGTLALACFVAWAWRRLTGGARLAWLASVCFVLLLYELKDTGYVAEGMFRLGALAAAAVLAWAGLSSWRGAADARSRRKGGAEAGGFSFRELLTKVGDRYRAALLLVGAPGLFVLLWVLFYSSFFTYWQGVFPDSLKAFDLWGKTGMSEFHSKPFHTYVIWLCQEEAPILVLAVAGTAAALFERRKNRFAVFAAAWAFGLLVAYSVIKYKTPWLVLSFVVPLAIVAGYAVQKLYDWGRADSWGRGGIVLALVVAGIALAVGTYQTVVLNFREYDNDRYPYVYSHTVRQALDMLKEVERAAARAGTREPGINVASPEYWPLPWYFRDNPHVGYVGSVSPHYDPQSTLMVIGRKSDSPQEDQYQKLRAALAADYVEAGTYPLRPGVTLVLFERRDLAAK